MPGENYFKQFSEARDAEREKLQWQGYSDEEIRRRLCTDFIPRLIRGGLDAVPHQDGDDEIDTRWDTPDAEGNKPTRDEAVAEVEARLEANRSRFWQGR